LGKIYAHMFLYPLDKQIAICVDRKINCLISLTATTLLDLKQSDVELINDAGRKIQIAYHAPPHDMFPGSVDPYVRKVAKLRLSETLDLASKTHATHIVAHINYIEDMHKYHVRSWIENSLELFEELIRLYRVPIHIENGYEQTPEIFYRMLKEAKNDLLGFALDIGHVLAYSKEPLEIWISRLSDYIREIHIHETRPGVDEHLAVGSGLVDWDQILAMLENNGVSINRICITIEPRNENDLDRSIRYLRDTLGLI